MKKLNSYWYCTEDIRKVNGEHRYVSDPNGYSYISPIIEQIKEKKEWLKEH